VEVLDTPSKIHRNCAVCIYTSGESRSVMLFLSIYDVITNDTYLYTLIPVASLHGLLIEVNIFLPKRKVLSCEFLIAAFNSDYICISCFFSLSALCSQVGKSGRFNYYDFIFNVLFLIRHQKDIFHQFGEQLSLH